MNSNLKTIVSIFFLTSIVSGQSKSDEWNLYTTSRENYNGVAMANGQIGIVTDDTPLKTKEIILNGVYEGSPETELAEL